MRVPGRLHITWGANESTLKIDTDAGTAVTGAALRRRGASGRRSAGWQGYSVARWEIAGPPARGGGGGGRGVVTIGGVGAAAAGRCPGGRGRGAPAPRYGSLKVITTHMKAGYLRKNGVPYSENAVCHGVFDRHNESNGDQWFTVTTIVEDPELSGSAVHYEHALQEGAGRCEIRARGVRVERFRRHGVDATVRLKSL